MQIPSHLRKKKQSGDKPASAEPTRRDLLHAIFRLCDADADGLLCAEEMRVFAQQTGLEGMDDKQWKDEFALLCSDNGADPSQGPRAASPGPQRRSRAPPLPLAPPPRAARDALMLGGTPCCVCVCVCRMLGGTQERACGGTWPIAWRSARFGPESALLAHRLGRARPFKFGDELSAPESVASFVTFGQVCVRASFANFGPISTRARRDLCADFGHCRYEIDDRVRLPGPISTHFGPTSARLGPRSACL